ncbi:MAG: TonB family protein [Candidatus Methylopumilus sp.]|jgi:protein TonB|nr:TonB family protein [Candidatus Methylopumilus sp.]
MSALDVVLVNSKHRNKPKKADVLAQTNLDGGGNTSENRQLKSALPWQKNKLTDANMEHRSKAFEKRLAQAEAEANRKAVRLAELNKEAQALMSQLKATHVIETNPTQTIQPTSPGISLQDSTIKQLNTSDLMSASLEMARLEAQVNKQQDDYQKRPKRKSIGARAQEYRFASYVESWRQKVERIGNVNYPEAAKDQKIYGQLQLTVYIKSSGDVEKVEIRRSSGYPVLDNAAKSIVEMGSPYAAFPEDLRKEVDILDITRTWIFTKEDSLATKATE